MIFQQRGSGRTRYGAVVDVRPSSIGVAIVASNTSENSPHIIAHSRIATPFFNTKNTSAFQPLVQDTFRQLEKLLQEYVHTATEALGKPQYLEEVVVSVTAPWSRVTSRTVVYTREDPFRITESLLYDLVQQAEKDIDASVQETDIAKACGFNIGSRSVLQEYVNDYPVQNALGKRGSSLKLTHVTNLIAAPLAQHIDRFVDNIFPDTDYRTYAHLFVLFAIIHTTLPELQSFAVIHITDEETEIGVVKNGTVRYTTHLPYGSETLVRNCTSIYNTPREDILSRLQGIAEGTIQDNTQQAIMNEIDSYKDVVRPLVATVFEQYYLPRTIVTVAPSAVARVLNQNVVDLFSETGSDTPHILDALDKSQFPIAAIHDDNTLAALAWFFHIKATKQEL